MGIFEKDIKVVRNDKMTIKEIEQLNPDRIVLSPGPKSPKEAGICIEMCIRDSVHVAGINAVVWGLLAGAVLYFAVGKATCKNGLDPDIIKNCF